MIIEYESKDIDDLLTDYNLLKKKVGADFTKSIVKRLQQIIASNNFEIFLSTGLGKPHSLTDDLTGYYAITISANYRLILKPKTENYNSESLQKCDTVVIKGVIDYHGKNKKWLIP